MVIVILTEWSLYRFVLVPAYQEAGLNASLTPTQMILLAVITAMITGGGYVINDIVDHKIDLINRPDKVIVNRKISLPVAHLLYFSLNLFGLILAFYLALKTDNLHLIFIYPIALIGLYYYSTAMKKLVLVDNLLVSLYCAGVAGIVWIAERRSIRLLAEEHPGIARYVFFIFGAYMIFAFLTTLIREIIKDMEDLEGDDINGCLSLPIVIGIPKTKNVVYLLSGLLLSALIYTVYHLKNDLAFFQLMFIGLALIFPLLFEVYQLVKAQNKNDFHKLSQLAKISMLAGIIFIVIISLK